MRRATKIGVIAGIALAAVVVGVAVSGKPVLFSFTEPGDLRRPTISLLNPLRNREPEKVAEDVLRDLQRGDVSAAIARMQVPGGVSPMLYAKEREYPLRKWKLVDRHDGAQQVTLLYRASRDTSEQFHWQVTMKVQRRDGRWTVTDFDTAY